MGTCRSLTANSKLILMYFLNKMCGLLFSTHTHTVGCVDLQWGVSLCDKVYESLSLTHKLSAKQGRKPVYELVDL